MVENADTGKAKSEKFITRFARYYTPAVVAVAALLALVPPLIVGGELACLVKPFSDFSGDFLPLRTGRVCPADVLWWNRWSIKKGHSRKKLQLSGMMAHIKTVVFDKTGTLTEGNFSVTAVIFPK